MINRHPPAICRGRNRAAGIDYRRHISHASVDQRMDIQGRLGFFDLTVMFPCADFLLIIGFSCLSDTTSSIPHECGVECIEPAAARKLQQAAFSKPSTPDSSRKIATTSAATPIKTNESGASTLPATGCGDKVQNVKKIADPCEPDAVRPVRKAIARS